MRKLFKFIVLIGFIFTGSVCQSKEFTCEKYKLPILLRNPYTYKGLDTTATKTVKVREKPAMQSKIIDVLKKGEKVDGVESLILIQSLGKGRIVGMIDPLDLPGSSPPKGGNNPAGNLNDGDIIPLVSYMGEGHFTACIGKEEFEVGDPGSTAGIKIEMGHSSEEVLLPLGVEYWLRIGTPGGKDGFVNAKEEFLNPIE